MCCADYLDSEEDRKTKQRRYLTNFAIQSRAFDEERAQLELEYERITDQ